MTRRRWAALAVALAVVETSAAIAGMWIAVAVTSAALTGLACLRLGWLWATSVAAERERRATAALHEQLDNDETELTHRRELDHAQIRDGGPWRDNGAGYRSPRFTPSDSPAQTGAELSQGAS